jgi:hypothetical protein
MLTVACADAPITAADIQADGQLRETASQTQQSVHAASEQSPKAQRAEHLRVTGLLAAQADGALEDATRFSGASEVVYLHLRADDLSEPRPVTFVWSHTESYRRETMGFLQPSETISLAASLPVASLVADAEAAAAELTDVIPGEAVPNPIVGEWKVEVYSTDASRSLLFAREFELVEAEAYDAMMAMALAEAEAEFAAAGVAH